MFDVTYNTYIMIICFVPTSLHMLYTYVSTYYITTSYVGHVTLYRQACAMGVPFLGITQNIEHIKHI